MIFYVSWVVLGQQGKGQPAARCLCLGTLWGAQLHPRSRAGGAGTPHQSQTALRPVGGLPLERLPFESRPGCTKVQKRNGSSLTERPKRLGVVPARRRPLCRLSPGQVRARLTNTETTSQKRRAALFPFGRRPHKKHRRSQTCVRDLVRILSEGCLEQQRGNLSGCSSLGTAALEK